MSRAMDPRRVKDIEAAIARAQPRSRLTLAELSTIWGVSKARFVTVRNQMAGFPEAVDQSGNELLYPAIKALRAMLNYERRFEKLAAKRSEEAAAILGKARKGGDQDGPLHSASELAILSRLASEIEERERDQGNYIPRAEAARVAGDVFAEVSDLLSRLSDACDPTGRWSTEVRSAVDRAGQERLLRVHGIMRDILRPDAQPGRSQQPAKGAGKPRSRR